MAHMVENTDSVSVKFSASEIKELNDQIASIEIKGQRLPDYVLAYSGVEAPLPR